MPARHVHQRLRWLDRTTGRIEQRIIPNAFAGHRVAEESPPRADTNIEIDSPTPGEEVTSPVPITGTVTGTLGGLSVNVIDLATGFGQASPPSVSGDGPWTWTVTFSLSPGNYRVDATSTTAMCTDTDSVFFSVVPSEAAGSPRANRS